jgi:hypothetical protein
VGSICSAERAAMRGRVIFISKHQCRLGGDCADFFRPPRADDHRVTSNRSSKGNVHWRKVGDVANRQASNATTSLKSLALPRGLRRPSEFNHLAKSGTPNRSTQSLDLLPPVSHLGRTVQLLTSEDVAPSATVRLPITVFLA